MREVPPLRIQHMVLRADDFRSLCRWSQVLIPKWAMDLPDNTLLEFRDGTWGLLGD